jgi:hypothetical protein
MSTRVEQILQDIGRLSANERQELERVLPRVLRDEPGGTAAGGLNQRALERVDEIREEIRVRLLADGQPLFSITEDLEATRQERDQELQRPLAPADRS